MNLNIFLFCNIKSENNFRGFGDWVLGMGDWGLAPIPNPQSPIPNPHYVKAQFKFNMQFN